MQSKRKKKICYVITKGTWGGAQKYVYTLATSLPKDTYDVSVIMGVGGKLEEKLRESGIRVHIVNTMKRDISIVSEFKSFFSLLKILKKERPHVLHLNSPKASGLGAVAGRMLGIKNIIFTAHGWTFNEERNLFEKTLIVFLSWITVFLCHKTIVINDHERQQTEAMPFSHPSHIHLIKNGIEEVYFKDQVAARKELLSHAKVQIPHDAVWIGTICELHKNKGLEYVLEALSWLRSPFVFFIIGEGEERENIERIIRENKLQNKVFLTGFRNRASQYLKAFDIFTLTSLKEGLPYTILEAGQAGVPVIASYTGGIPEIIDNGIHGLLAEKADPQDILLDLEYMIENPEDRKLFAKNLQEKVKDEFSLSEMLEKTEELYER